MSFYNWLGEHPKTEPQQIQSEYVNNYQEEIDEDGKLSLVITGVKNMGQEIESHGDECKIENILAAAARGDMSGLQQREAYYVDTTEMPKTLMEAQNIVIKAKQEFYTLPLEVRKEFDNSPEMYVSEMGTETFNKKMAPYNKKIAEMNNASSLEEYNKKVAAQAKFEKDVSIAKGVANEN